MTGVCPLMHEPSAANGWDLCPITLDGRPLFTHLVPCGDLKRHQLDATCWCDPQADEEEPSLIVHNAADGREEFEEGRAVS